MRAGQGHHGDVRKDRVKGIAPAKELGPRVCHPRLLAQTDSGLSTEGDVTGVRVMQRRNNSAHYRTQRGAKLTFVHRSRQVDAAKN